MKIICKTCLIISLFIVYALQLGAQNQCLNLNGTTDYASIPNLGITASNNLSMEAWVYSTGTQNAWSGIIVFEGFRGGLIFRSGNELGYMWEDTNGDRYGWSSGLIVPQNKWCHVALVISPTQAVVYLDGAKSVHVKNCTPQTIGIGKIGTDRAVSGRFFKGQIADVRVWNTARTDTQIWSNPCSIASPGSEPNLVAYFPCSTSNAKILTDVKGTHNGTLTGCTYLPYTNTSCVPMAYVSTTCSHTVTDEVLPGTTYQQLLRINVKTTGNVNPLSVTDFGIDLSGSTAISDLSAVHLFYSGSSAALTVQSQFGASLTPAAGVIKFTGTQPLQDGDNYFWVLADVAAEAPINDVIDAKCTALTVSTIEQSPINGDPAGNRKIVASLTAHPKSGWSIKYFSSQELSGEGTNGRAAQIIDGNPETFWASQWVGNFKTVPHEIQIDLGYSTTVREFKLWPRQGNCSGKPLAYELYVSEDGVNWGTAVKTGSFAWASSSDNNPQDITFEGKLGRFIKFRQLSTYACGTDGVGCIGEIDINPTTISYIGLTSAPAHKLALWYRKPAQSWESEALPIGNGYMGGMIYGGVAEEQVQYNEKTLWTGGPSASRPTYQGGNKNGAAGFLKQAKVLLAAGNKTGAMDYMNTNCSGDWSNNSFGYSQSFGDLKLRFTNMPSELTVSNYRRELDMEDGVVRVSYTLNGLQYLREYFCSYPDKVMVMRLTCSQPGKLNFDVIPGCGQPGGTITASGSIITTKGALTDNGMLYESQIKVINDGGIISTGIGRVTVINADAVLIVMSAGTNYANVYPAYRGVDPHATVTSTVNAASSKTFAQLLASHQADYKNLFGRVDISLSNDAGSTVPTNELKKVYKTNKSNTALEVLAFQYGRYLLIQSSREGSLPAHLQGVWVNSNTPAWFGDYHFDYNVQMNYCGAEVSNLNECSTPFVDFMYSIIKPGQITAEKHFGVTNGGWILNTSVNPFGFTAPGWDCSWGWQPEGGPWGAQYAWDAYKFTGDTTLLKTKIYPVIKGSSDFWKGWMIEDTDKTLISYPSVSLEEGPLGVPMIDQMLAWEVMNNTIEAANTLKIDQADVPAITQIRDKISPPKVGSFGQLQEWKEELDKQGYYAYGMIPQAIAIYAGRRISIEKTPVWANAAMKSLSLADAQGTTGIQAWYNYNRGPVWARFYKGESAYIHYSTMISALTLDNMFSTTNGTMQLDGSFAATGMMAEMLIQSHLDNVRVLPALPAAWSTGSFKGLCARGGFVVDARWSGGVLTSADVYSRNGDTLNFVYGDKSLRIPTTAGGSYHIEYNGIALTSIKSVLSHKRKVTIFPNPASSNLIITLNQPSNKMDMTVVLSDLNGKRILTKEMPKGQLQIDIDISGLMNGIYFVSLMGETEKLIVSR